MKRREKVWRHYAVSPRCTIRLQNKPLRAINRFSVLSVVCVGENGLNLNEQQQCTAGNDRTTASRDG